MTKKYKIKDKELEVKNTEVKMIEYIIEPKTNGMGGHTLRYRFKLVKNGVTVPWPHKNNMDTVTVDCDQNIADDLAAFALTHFENRDEVEVEEEES